MYLNKNERKQIPIKNNKIKKDYKLIDSQNKRKDKNKINIKSIPKKSLLLLNILISAIYLLLKNINEIIIYDTIKYDIVIPLNINDTKTFIQQLDILKKYLYFDKMVIISKNNPKIINENISTIFINEEQLIQRENLISIFNKLGINETGRVNWYLQQFLKMSYSRICKNEYYLLWDSDTIPIRHINMFDNGHPLFDMKDEHHSPYFVTLQRLIPNLYFSKQSYISEHMIIKTEYMNNLLEQIENNNIISGKYFWEKILMSIDLNELTKSGFSEFEAYGNFVDTKFPRFYKHRNWSSKRDMSKYFGSIKNLNKQDFNWLSKDYYSITFEKWEIFENYNLNFVKNIEIQKLSRPKRLFKYYKRIIKKYRRKNFLSKKI
jgi:hypothetical protein